MCVCYDEGQGDLLGLDFHENCADFWSTKLLDVLKTFSLIKVFSLYCSESHTLDNKAQKTTQPRQLLLIVITSS